MAETSKSKRTTIYIDAETHRALKLKAIVAEKSISYLINEAVRRTLAEDAEDLAVFEERAHKPVLDFEEVVKDLRRRGRI
jgi:predicted transcriptional regulator